MKINSNENKEQIISQHISNEKELVLYIIRRRKALGITQNQLARLIGASQTQISRYELLERSMQLKTLYKICEVLSMDIGMIDRTD